jgi:predicted DNA-binding protein with PD1-like motif
MEYKLIEDGPQKIYSVSFDTGDEVLGNVLDFARENRCTAGHFSGVGAFCYSILGFFDWNEKDYRPFPVAEQVEVLSLVGDIALDGLELKAHAHVAIARPDGTVYGGELLEGYARTGLELQFIESPERILRPYITGVNKHLRPLRPNPDAQTTSLRGPLS